MTLQTAVMDGNTAAAHVAYRVNEVCAIFPITPSSTMAELADAWAAEGIKNIWGEVPVVQQMQSEAGAAGAVHGSLQSGALTTTFTASQGFLLMLPNMYKIAGELTACVFHVTARAVATQALSIFGDHSDVMSARMTGFAMLSAGSVQEAHDLALVAQAATLESRVPVIFFFDGFRTSHEENTTTLIPDEQIRAMIDDDLVRAHRARALSPDHPVVRGTAHNPDTYFQARESANPFYAKVPGIVQKAMDRLGALTERKYHLFRYSGHPQAERVIVAIGSAVEVLDETAAWLSANAGEKLGVLQVRLYRPWDGDAFLAAMPKSVKTVAVLDRTKEVGSPGEPLYIDVLSTYARAAGAGKIATMPTIIGGRYGLSSKDFDPAMAKAVFDELKKPAPQHGFTVGITDDVSHISLPVDRGFDIEPPEIVRALFYGLGADGTVGANKNSTKILASEPGRYAQGYFVYDSKKSGSFTISHLRFGPKPIHAPYLLKSANFIGVHKFDFLFKIDTLAAAAQGGTVLLNSPFGPDEVWNELPREVQKQIIVKNLKLHVIDASKVALSLGLGSRTNTILQTCFFALSGVMPRDQAIAAIKKATEKTYARKGKDVVKKNFEAIDAAVANLFEVKIPAAATGNLTRYQLVPDTAPEFVRNVTSVMLALNGDDLPVSALPVDGTYPTATTQYEKRNIAEEVPVWEPDLCIQCGQCAVVCPHSVIRAKYYDADRLAGAPADFKAAPINSRGYPDSRYTLQIYVEDCTGCGVCVENCPAHGSGDLHIRAINMKSRLEHLQAGRRSIEFFEKLPWADRARVNFANVRGVQFLQPLFEFSGACAGCGETPYLKMLSQLFGDRLQIANATGCSSIYGGNLPTTPWAKNPDGRGPAWSNSLFEDNAEFGLGYRLAIDKQTALAHALARKLAPQIGGAPFGCRSCRNGKAGAPTANRPSLRCARRKLIPGRHWSSPTRSALRMGPTCGSA
jgi:pyruvate-ferredoxin/flavodoxin oxidoreductase